jgi:formate hydrogenlyase subunit 6/NADH:ubiquinone oxidoreductase subunit I
MRIGTMIRDVISAILSRPATEKYPFERRPVPERLRGSLHWDPEKCTGCALCSKDCPANALEVITLDKKAKRFAVRYYVDRCIYCAQCVQNCRFNCLEMAKDEWELAARQRGPFTVTYGREAELAELVATMPPAEVKAVPAG